MRVVILGKGEMLANLIEGALDAGGEIVGVLRYEQTTQTPFRLALQDFFNPSNELTIIKQHKLKQLKCKSANSKEFKKEILKLNADIILVGTWREKLDKETINLPVIASINVHPSLLPTYRGPNPYLQTILNRETKSGITFHLMNENFDEGAILSQKKIDILPNDTAKELKARTLFNARLMCAELLKKLEYGLIIPIEQSHEKATYFPNIKPEDMMLDFKKEDAYKIHARIRAFHPWLPCYVTYKNKYFIPNPYKLKINSQEKTTQILAENNIQSPKIGDIIDSQYKNSKTITVLCQNGLSIEMDDIKIYGFFNKLLFKQILKIF